MRYCFADCILDTQLYTLSRAGITRLLRPKVFQVLQYLLAHRDQVVSKEALCAQVWSDRFISDTTLESCIKQIRQAIGDSGQAQQLIQTRRGYGYRFIGTVKEQPEARPAQESAAAVPTSPTTPPQDDMPRRPAPARLPGEDPVASGAGAASPALRSSLSPRAAHERSGQGVPDGERKLVTLLGCTLAHALALRARCGLDALHSRMRTLYTLMQQEVHQYGGTIHHVAGERLLAVFGAPVAQEDHARRAVLAACGLLQRLAACRDPAGAPTEEPLAVCLGLHTGMIVVGGIGEASEPAAVVGDLTLVVDALQVHAAPGALLCSEATARLIQGEVRLKAHRPVPVPGPPTPLQAYQVLGVHPREHPAVRRMGRVESPFVGRTQALAALHALLAQVEEGRGQVVGVVGEPGIGKSRLLAEFHHSLQGRHLRCHYGRCLSYGQTTPYLPVLDLLRHFCDLTAADSPEGLTAKIHHKLREVRVAPEEAAVYLLALLGVETGTAELAALAPEVRKARTFATLVQCCIHGSQSCPLVLEIEDLHWSDTISAEWLTALVERIGNVPLLVLGTYRPGYRPGWLEKSYATQVALQPLSPRDSRRVVQALLPMAQRSAALEQAILAKADGNPFFLEELVQTVVEQGGRPLSLGVPDTVQAVLAARIDRLPPAEKHILQIAAVIGAEVPVPLVQALAELPEDALQRGLAHLQAAELLYETRLVPERAFTFKHALTQEVAYGSLLQARRRALHARIIEAMEARASDRVAEQVERLAHHALRGEVWDKALAYCRQAGIKAGKRSGTREAVTCFEQALGALQHLPESSNIHEQAIDLRFYLVDALFPLGELTQGFEHLCAAQTLAEAMDNQRRLGRVSSIMTLYFWLAGDYARALASGQRALAIAQALDDFPLQVRTHFFLGITYHALGEYCRAIEVLRWNVASLDGELIWRSLGMQGLPAVLSRSWLVWCLAERGTFAEGIVRGAEGYRIAEAADNPFSLVVAYFSVSNLYVCKGEVHQAIPVLERSLEIFRTGDLPFLFPYVASLLGYAYALSGRVAEAIPLLEQAMKRGTAMGTVENQSRQIAWRGEAHLLSGRIDDARALALCALDLSRQRNERGHQAFVLRLLGEIYSHHDPAEVEQAETHYHQALALAEELGMRPLQAHCHLGLGRLYGQTGRAEQACTALSAAIDLYRAMDMTFWLPQTEAALAQVEVQS